MTTPVWFTGFEYGLTYPVASGGGLCDLVTGNCSVINAVPHTGSYHLRCISSTTAFAFISRTISGSPTCLVGRFYIYFHDALPAQDIVVFSVTTTGHKVQFIYDQSAGMLSVGIDGATTTAAASNVALATWYCIDFKIDVSANPWLTDWQIDGVAQTQNSYAHAAEVITNMDIGIYTKPAAGRSVYYDDVIISVTSGDYPIGTGGTIGLRPNADGTHNNGANILEKSNGVDIDGTPAWDVLDENPWVLTANTDYVRQQNVGAANYCEVQYADTTLYIGFLGVMALLEYASSAVTANTGGCIVRDSDGTTTTLWGAPGALADYSETSAFYKKAIVTVPAGGWTNAYVNSLRCRFGYSDNVASKPYWLATMLEVAYSYPHDSILDTNVAIGIESIADVTDERVTNAAIEIESIADITDIQVTNVAIMVEWSPPYKLKYDVTQVI